MKRAGFTLVELLVSVAIVGLLSMLVLAGVKSARERGEATQCLANLKQLAAANLLYAAENDGYYAPAQDARNRVRWHGVRNATTGRFDPRQGALAPYLGSEARVKECPTMRHCVAASESFEEGTGGYGYNAAYLGGTPADPFTPERMANVAKPERTVMFTDSALARQDGVQEYAYAEPWVTESPRDQFGWKLTASVHFRHGGRANVAWADGHVSSEQPREIDGGNYYGGDGKKWKLGWFGPPEMNGYWRPY